MSLPRELGPQEVHRILTSDPTVTYVDVRSSAEFASGHVPGSTNVPLAELDPARGLVPNPAFLPQVEKAFAKDRALIIGCASGGRSRQAISILEREGWKNLCNMAGGFAGQRGPAGSQPGWTQLGLPVESGASKS
jgi:rhodanese-related sulfurtransferase